jgi:hypothetical protein
LSTFDDELNDQARANLNPMPARSSHWHDSSEASPQSKLEWTTVGIKNQPVDEAGPTLTYKWNRIDFVQLNPT